MFCASLSVELFQWQKNSHNLYKYGIYNLQVRLKKQVMIVKTLDQNWIESKVKRLVSHINVLRQRSKEDNNL